MQNPRTIKLRAYLYVFLLIIIHCAVPAGAVSSWEQLYPGHPTHGFNDIYAAGTDSAFAVGNFGLIYRYDGSAWAVMTGPVGDDLNAVWGRSASDVYAVGNNGTILHFNGSAWQKMSSPTGINLHSVWGLPGTTNPVYAGGRDGTILKYAGGSWTFMQTGLADGIWDYTIIYGIWGTSAANLYAVGYMTGDDTEDIYLHCTDGASWQRITGPTGSDSPATFFPVAVWGVNANLVYIGGDGGIYSLVNGTTWTLVLPVSGGITDIWGFTSTDIWAVGDSINHYDGSWTTVIGTVDPQNQWGGLFAVSGSGAANVLAAGSAGRIYRYQGSAWSAVTRVPDYAIYDLWRDTDDSLCAVGENGLVIRYDGTGWRPMAGATNEDLAAVCGWGNGHYLAVGAAGTVQYFNGSTWSLVTSTTTESLHDTWCLAPDAAFVVGANGTILNCGGTGCSAETTDGTTSTLNAVYSSTLGSYAVGAGGVLMHKDGSTWNTVTPTSPVSVSFTDLWGDPLYGGLVAVGGNSIYAYNVSANSWTPIYQDPGVLSLQKIIGASYADILAAGYGGTYDPYSGYPGMIIDISGTTVKEFAGYHAYTIQAGTGGSLFVGGARQDLSAQWHGQVLLYDGTSWTSMIESNSLTDIWGGGLDSVFVVGAYGTILHYDGSTVRPMAGNTVTSLEAVYAGTTGNWAAAAGWLGEMFYYDGSAWAEAVNPSPDDWINDMWGAGDTVYAVGDNGSILQSQNRGANWTAMSNPSMENLRAVWGAAEAGPVFAAGDNATILRYAGNWTAMPSGALSYIDFNGIWGTSADDVYAVGDTWPMLGANESQIVRYNGSTWTESYYGYNVLPPKYLTGVWGASADDVIAFGNPNLRRECGRSWREMSDAGIPPLVKGWGKEDQDGDYHIFGITAYDSIYHYIIPADRRCSSPWSLFLPAILAPKK